MEHKNNMDISSILKGKTYLEKVELLQLIMTKLDKLNTYAKNKLLNLHYGLTTKEEVRNNLCLQILLSLACMMKQK